MASGKATARGGKGLRYCASLSLYRVASWRLRFANESQCSSQFLMSSQCRRALIKPPFSSVTFASALSRRAMSTPTMPSRRSNTSATGAVKPPTAGTAATASRVGTSTKAGDAELERSPEEYAEAVAKANKRLEEKYGRRYGKSANLFMLMRKWEELSHMKGIFSKHGGKMVLGFLGALGLWFLRNHLGSKALDAVKDEVEEACPLEPHEVEELRCTNDYPPHTFRKVLDSAREAFPSGRTTYPAFVRHVTSSGLLPEPLSMGFLLDRVALGAAGHPGITGAAARGEAISEDGSSRAAASGFPGSPEAFELDLDFLMVAFSAAVNTTPAERVRQLWDLARDRAAGSPRAGFGETQGLGQGGDGQPEDGVVPANTAMEMVGMLMAAQQLPAGRYATKDANRKWPVQQYRLATGRDAFLRGLEALHEDQEKRSKGWIERKVAPKYEATKEEQISFELFERVLRSSPVCAWGECLEVRRHNKL